MAGAVRAGSSVSKRATRSANAGDQVRPVHGELPLESEVALVARVGGARNHWDEQGAGFDLLPDRRVPAAQFALVEPDFEAR